MQSLPNLAKMVHTQLHVVVLENAIFFAATVMGDVVVDKQKGRQKDKINKMLN